AALGDGIGSGVVAAVGAGEDDGRRSARQVPAQDLDKLGLGGLFVGEGIEGELTPRTKSICGREKVIRDSAGEHGCGEIAIVARDPDSSVFFLYRRERFAFILNYGLGVAAIACDVVEVEAADGPLHLEQRLELE